MRCGTQSLCAACTLAANVAADDDVVRGHVRVDRVRDNAGGHGELDRRGVDDADNVARARGLEDGEEWPVEAVLGVELDDLLVICLLYTSPSPRD